MLLSSDTEKFSMDIASIKQFLNDNGILSLNRLTLNLEVKDN